MYVRGYVSISVVINSALSGPFSNSYPGSASGGYSVSKCVSLLLPFLYGGMEVVLLLLHQAAVPLLRLLAPLC